MNFTRYITHNAVRTGIRARARAATGPVRPRQTPAPPSARAPCLPGGWTRPTVAARRGSDALATAADLGGARRHTRRPGCRQAVNSRAPAGAQPAQRRRRARLLGRHHAQHPARGGRERAVSMGRRGAESMAAAAEARAGERRGHARPGRSGGGAQRGACRESTDDDRRAGRHLRGDVGLEEHRLGRNSHLPWQRDERRDWSVSGLCDDGDARERRKAVRYVCATV